MKWDVAKPLNGCAEGQVELVAAVEGVDELTSMNPDKEFESEGKVVLKEN